MTAAVLVLVGLLVLAAVAAPWVCEAQQDQARQRRVASQVAAYRQEIARRDGHRLAGTDDGIRGDAPGAFDEEATG